MISVDEATDIILQYTLTLPAEVVELKHAVGRVLAEDLIADRDFPPFDRVTMDGIAIDFESWLNGTRIFPIQEISPAGHAQAHLKDSLSCIEIMTGAVLPAGCDTVIRYEDLEIALEGDSTSSPPSVAKGLWPAETDPLPARRTGTLAGGKGEPHPAHSRNVHSDRTSPLGDRGAREGIGKHPIAKVLVPEIIQGQNVHRQGTDRKQGDVIVRRGRHLSAAEIGVAATIGKSTLLVGTVPRIAIVSTGDELVAVDAIPLPHQIRQSNAQQIKAVVEQFGIPASYYHVQDDPGAVEHTLQRLCTEYDCIVLSGGVSAGMYDYVPSALDKIGVQKLFHKVAQRPGKPFWFGVLNTDKVVFALPGNPVSSFMCAIRYVRPWVEATLGISQRPQYAILSEDVAFRPALTYFLQVRFEYRSDGCLYAIPIAGHGSGDLANLVEADGFLELTGAKELYRKGEVFRVWTFR